MYISSSVQLSICQKNPEALKQTFCYIENAQVECKRCLEENLPLPAYDYCLMASHTFNVLDARKAISVTQRQNYILKIRELAKGCAVKYKEVVG